MLEEPQLAAGSEHPSQLGEGPARVGDRAQHQGGDSGVKAPVGKWQRVGVPGHHADRHRCVGGGALGECPQPVLRLDGDHLIHRVGVVAEVHAVPGSYLDYPAGEVGQGPVALGGGTPPL